MSKGWRVGQNFRRAADETLLSETDPDPSNLRCREVLKIKPIDQLTCTSSGSLVKFSASNLTEPPLLLLPQNSSALTKNPELPRNFYRAIT
jgi:hypothetical protein